MHLAYAKPDPLFTNPSIIIRMLWSRETLNHGRIPTLVDAISGLGLIYGPMRLT